MIISISSIKQFKKCQRQWCFKQFSDFREEKDSFRRELYLLSKLQSVYAWRGSLVDYVITKRIIPALVKGWNVDPVAVKNFARHVFEKQLAFAKAHRLRESDMAVSKAGEDFAAFAAVEFFEELTEEILQMAWNDVELALDNLLAMDDLLTLLRSASQLITQRPLTFEHLGLTFRAVPDLIAFFENRAPLIVDWKVQSNAIFDYQLQLAAYAIALTRCTPHRDFPASLASYSATDIQMIEAQLLMNVPREHRLEGDDFLRADNFITSAALEITLAADGKPGKDLDPYDFPVTLNPDNCERCNFRKVCMEEPVCQQPVQMSLLF